MAPEPDFSHHRAAWYWAWNRGVEGDKKKAVRKWKSFLHCLFELFTGSGQWGSIGRLLSKSYFIPFSCPDVIFIIEVPPDIDG